MLDCLYVLDLITYFEQNLIFKFLAYASWHRQKINDHIKGGESYRKSECNRHVCNFVRIRPTKSFVEKLFWTWTYNAVLRQAIHATWQEYCTMKQRWGVSSVCCLCVLLQYGIKSTVRSYSSTRQSDHDADDIAHRDCWVDSGLHEEQEENCKLFGEYEAGPQWHYDV